MEGAEVNPKKRETQRPDAGIAIIYVAVFLLASLWFVSLAIDMGKLMATRTELQNAADAAALAGASAIDPSTGQIVQDVARTRSAATAAANKAFEGNPTPVTIDAQLDVDFPAERQVRVRVHREAATGNPMITHFAQTVGLLSLNVRADATAEAKQLKTVCEGLAPFAPQELPNGQQFSTDCDSEYVLKQSAGNGQQGNYQLLRFPPCNEDDFTGGGGSAIRHYTEYGYQCCEEIGAMLEVETKTGNTVGPLRQALQARFDADGDHRQGICYQDYLANQSNNPNFGKRVFITPIIESFNVNGTSWVKIKGFAAFFLKYRPSGGGQVDITGQFIKYVAPGEFGTGVVNSGIYGIHLVE
jgi:Putative Flp pilus-assembly TadE/G-like